MSGWMSHCCFSFHSQSQKSNNQINKEKQAAASCITVEFHAIYYALQPRFVFFNYSGRSRTDYLWPIAHCELLSGARMHINNPKDRNKLGRSTLVISLQDNYLLRLNWIWRMVLTAAARHGRHSSERGSNVQCFSYHRREFLGQSAFWRKPRPVVFP